MKMITVDITEKQRDDLIENLTRRKEKRIREALHCDHAANWEGATSESKIKHVKEAVCHRKCVDEIDVLIVKLKYALAV